MRLRKAKIDALLDVADRRGKRQRFSQSQEIVRLVGSPHETPGKSADSAREADGLLALFLHLQLDVHGAGLHVLFQLGILRLDRLEISQLVQSQQAQFPEAVVKDLALVQQQLAADYLVASRGVAGKFDSSHEELLLLIERKRQIHHFLRVLHVELRFGGEVDVPVFAVEFREILERLADLARIENVALFNGKRLLQNLLLENQTLVRIRTPERQLPHAKLRAFFHRNDNVGRLPVPVADQRETPIHIHGLQFLHVHNHLEVAVVLVQTSDAHFHIFVEFGAVEGLAHHRNVSDVERNPVGPVISHRADDFRAGECLVSHDRDVPDLYLRSFVYVEHQLYGVRRGDAFVGGLYGRELVAVRRQQALQHNLGANDLRWIELAFHRQADLLILEGVQNVRFRNRFVSLVLDAADDGPLRHVEDDNFAVRRAGIVFDVQPDVFEKLRVPKRLKIAVQRLHIIGIAHVRKNARLQGGSLQPPVPVKFDARDDVLRTPGFLRLLSPKGLAECHGEQTHNG